MTLSAHYTEMAKKNVHHHYLGPGGYYGNEYQFMEIEEEVNAVGTYNLQGGYEAHIELDPFEE